ncbi:hypothetical protein U9M48_004560 [Paspalum notatum var. saurae]|uniref:Importin alpha n=1 Tax=Paspalum notatum var. saurae TaxID=547442 RepID=A0AAQ3PNY7_PASNO
MAARAAIDGGVIYLDDGAGSNNYLGDGGDDFYLGGLLEAAWCLTNIAAGEPEETKSLLPALPLLIAHLGEKSPTLVAEQCGWAIGNVAGEGAELRSTLLAQGALWPLARLMLSNKGSAARTAAWALSNLIKVVFRGTYWTKFWSLLQKEEGKNHLKWACRLSEKVAFEVFAKNGWLSSRTLCA